MDLADKIRNSCIICTLLDGGEQSYMVEGFDEDQFNMESDFPCIALEDLEDGQAHQFTFSELNDLDNRNTISFYKLEQL